MAKPLVFEFGGETIPFGINKIDRSKLYGYKELEVLDEFGVKCEMATLAEDGHTLIAKGGTGMGSLSADGLWCDKATLRPVDVDGNTITPVGSSFSAPIPLSERQLSSADEYLCHTIRAIYAMETSDGGRLIESIQEGAIFKFEYSFRGGLEPDTAFLLANDSGQIFMAVGRPGLIEFVGLQQIAKVDDEGGADDEDEDEMDFGMI